MPSIFYFAAFLCHLEVEEETIFHYPVSCSDM